MRIALHWEITTIAYSKCVTWEITTIEFDKLEHANLQCEPNRRQTCQPIDKQKSAGTRRGLGEISRNRQGQQEDLGKSAGMKSAQIGREKKEKSVGTNRQGEEGNQGEKSGTNREEMGMKHGCRSGNKNKGKEKSGTN
ncbi:hypothetical protein F511_13390 [Dorcoceras hygrometricum]|uniref:Uncharacterized protein n=1 Tax=Dorcoceras hygrometricum TaxID=472368 RepID=A0A2Z7B686_9LAMI|nr:hypothetical protein F511_13390 [Dorcoceras hygrometricum]